MRRTGVVVWRQEIAGVDVALSNGSEKAGANFVDGSLLPDDVRVLCVCV